MRKVYCEELIERLVNYMTSMWMYDYESADRAECRKEIKEIMEEFENGKNDTEKQEEKFTIPNEETFRSQIMINGEEFVKKECKDCKNDEKEN